MVEVEVFVKMLKEGQGVGMRREQCNKWDREVHVVGEKINVGTTIRIFKVSSEGAVLKTNQNVSISKN